MEKTRHTPNQANRTALAGRVEVMSREPEVLQRVWEGGSSSGLVEYWRVVVRHKGTVLLLIVLGGLVGFISTLPEMPIYRAHTTVAVQGINENFLNMKDVSPTTTGGMMDPTADILTQVKLLESQ